MKFDVVIMGGGLAGLTAATELQSRGLRVAVVTTGQSALHFSSGSFELMSNLSDGTPVDNPMEGMKHLPADHPYQRIGLERVAELVPRVRPLLESAGLQLVGNDTHNHYRLTPFGMLKPAWLTIQGYATFDSQALPRHRVALLQIEGFLDFFPRFLAAGLEAKGMECRMATVTTPVIAAVRQKRATSIARVLHHEAVPQLARAINSVVSDVDDIYFPAVAGFDNMSAATELRRLVARPLHYIATMGTSVPGVRAQIMLEKNFRRLGGTYLPGDSVVGGRFDASGTHLQSLETSNFGNDRLEANTFIFAAGSFFSKGLYALPTGIIEPRLDLDVFAPTNRSEWFQKDIFKKQPYMEYGIATDKDLHPLRNGAVVENVYVVGSSLAGAHSLEEGSGAGVATVSALHVADKILGKA